MSTAGVTRDIAADDLPAEVDERPGEDGEEWYADDEPRRWRPRRRWVLAGTGALLVTAWWVGWVSPWTLVEHVVVEAPRSIGADRVRLASGIAATDHVPAVDADRVREAIMAAIPAVADVVVARELPGTIRLDVRPRRPLAAVDSAEGYTLMDRGGVLYDPVAEPGRLPVVEATTPVGLAAAHQVLISLPKRLRADVARLSAGTRDDVTLTLRDGATVRWGSAEQADLKARVLAGLIKVKANQYDVSAPTVPTTTGSRAGADGG